jgi:DNA-binding response OmpR family regulator
MTDKVRILVMDDSLIVLKMVASALTKAGLEVATASSLSEFEKILKEKPPQIILTGIKMPEISGDDICRVLKKKFDTQSTPIVLFSALPDQEIAALAERAGADGYVSKNAGVDEIVKSVLQLLDEIIF